MSAFLTVLAFVGTLTAVLAYRRRHRVNMLRDDLLDMDQDRTLWVDLDRRGWSKSHVDQVTALFIDPTARTSHAARSNAGGQRVAAWRVLGEASRGGIPGSFPEHQIAWIAATADRNTRDPLGAPLRRLDGPHVVRTATLDDLNHLHPATALAQMHHWSTKFGPGIAPLAAAAGLSYQEVVAGHESGTLDEESLRMMAALRGYQIPAYPPQASA